MTHSIKKLVFEDNTTKYYLYYNVANVSSCCFFDTAEEVPRSRDALNDYLQVEYNNHWISCTCREEETVKLYDFDYDGNEIYEGIGIACKKCKILKVDSEREPDYA